LKKEESCRENLRAFYYTSQEQS